MRPMKTARLSCEPSAPTFCQMKALSPTAPTHRISLFLLFRTTLSPRYNVIAYTLRRLPQNLNVPRGHGNSGAEAAFLSDLRVRSERPAACALDESSHVYPLECVRRKKCCDSELHIYTHIDITHLVSSFDSRLDYIALHCIALLLSQEESHAAWAPGLALTSSIHAF